MAEWPNPLLALEFLTVIRLRRWRSTSAEALARAQAFYPAVGALLGGSLIVTDLAVQPLLPPGPRAALLAGQLVVLTRGLHLDGLADSFDGLLGGATAERRLAIMRDPRAGSFGVLALILTVLGQWSCIAALSGGARWPALFLFPVLGRLAMVVAVASVPYARDQGLGVRYHEAARGLPLFVALSTAVGAGVVCFGWAGVGLVLVACVAGWAVALWARRAIGGATGDIYGMACVLGELAVLFCLAAGAHTGRLTAEDWW